MHRFLIFPPLFAVWLIAFQFGHTVTAYIATWYTLRIASATTDVYYVFPKNSTWVLTFLPAIMVGALLGLIFAASDFTLQRHKRTARETTLLLVPNLLKSSLVAIALVLLCQGILLINAIQQAHRRYHAYPPDMQWLNLIFIAQVFIVFAALLWAMAKTLKS
ncbi:hypothetical protein EON83_10310 [bacterium]|nr:MAG: hypothetical protein EON83_10310 [bacterium]